MTSLALATAARQDAERALRAASADEYDAAFVRLSKAYEAERQARAELEAAERERAETVETLGGALLKLAERGH